MRRSPIVLAATVVGTAGVMAFHPHTPAVQPAAATTLAILLGVCEEVMATSQRPWLRRREPRLGVG